MNKKLYVHPRVDVVKQNIERNILAGSGEGISAPGSGIGSGGNDPGDGTVEPGAKGRSEDWGDLWK